MFFTITGEAGSVESVCGLHRHEELLLPSTCRMECKKARRLATLNTCAFSYVAHRAFLPKKLSAKSKILPIELHTSLHRCFGILSASVIGSMNVSFITRVSGIQIAHKRWTQSPSTVCLKAPASLGHKMHDCEAKVVRAPPKKEATSALPRAFQVKRCIFGRAIDLQECTALRNNLDVQQDYTHRKKRSHSCSLPLSRRRWRMSSPQTALPCPAWVGSLSVCIVQMRTMGTGCDEGAPSQTNPSPIGP